MVFFLSYEQIKNFLLWKHGNVDNIRYLLTSKYAIVTLRAINVLVSRLQIYSDSMHHIHKDKSEYILTPAKANITLMLQLWNAVNKAATIK